MIELKTQNPYINESGKTFENLEKHYAEDESGKRYKILQLETGIVYDEAVDIYPCKYTYKATEDEVEIFEQNN